MMLSGVDQATGLRRMLRPPATRILPVFGTAERVCAIVNLATALVQARQQVLAVDASRGELAPAFGLSARYELKHVLEGEIAFRHAALVTQAGVQVLPAARGMRMIAAADARGLAFFESIAAMAAPLDVLLVNGDGAERATRLVPSHGEALFVLPYEAAAIAEGAARIKWLARHLGFCQYRVLVVRASYEDAQQAVATLVRQLRDMPAVKVSLGGNVVPDRRSWEAARAHRSIFEIDPAGPVARSYQNAAASLADWDLTVVTAPARNGATGARTPIASTISH